MTLREPSAERGVLRAALGPKLAELPAPVLALGARAALALRVEGRQLALVRPEGDELESRLRDGLRQVRASAGAGAVATVVEVAPWSRIPEQRALLVPRLNEPELAGPRPALVEERFDGSPRRVNRQAVEVVREEWRVVDRWWTEEPVNRRYFEVVLESGQNVVVFRDEERGGWFSQRGA